MNDKEAKINQANRNNPPRKTRAFFIVDITHFLWYNESVNFIGEVFLMKALKRTAALILAAVLSVMALTVSASAYDYQDYLKDAAQVTGEYTDYQLLRELGEVVTVAYRDYWTSADKYKNFYDGVNKYADENDLFYDDCMNAIIKIQRENSDSGLRLARPGLTKSEILAEQVKYAESLTGKTDIWDTALESVINSRHTYFKGISDAMMSFTDMYSKLITGKDYYADQDDSSVGLGITVQELGTSFLVQSVVTGGGAEAAGIKRGDAIIEINGKPITDNTANTRGKENTKINVTVLHSDNTIEEITVKRIKNNPGIVTSKRIDDTMIITFKEFTLLSDAEDFEKYYDEAAADPTIKKLVIDLRDNTGGDNEVLDAICSVLTEKDTLMFTIDSKTESEKHISKGKYKGAGVKFDGQIFVLTNEDTASCSDITTAVIKNIGGLQVGDPTYGKGIGQSGYIIHNGYMAWVTALYVDVPNFGYYHGTPFTPDVPIPGRVPAFTKDEILPLEDTKSPLTPDSPKERIIAYQQRLQSFMPLKLEITGELDARTIWLSDAVCLLAGIEPSKNGVISGEMVYITDANAKAAGLENISIFSETDDALQYCLDYGEETETTEEDNEAA
jgi:carboxyl-terminal processing protease